MFHQLIVAGRTQWLLSKRIIPMRLSFPIKSGAWMDGNSMLLFWCFLVHRGMVLLPRSLSTRWIRGQTRIPRRVDLTKWQHQNIFICQVDPVTLEHYLENYLKMVQPSISFIYCFAKQLNPWSLGSPWAVRKAWGSLSQGWTFNTWRAVSKFDVNHHEELNHEHCH